MNTEPLIIAGKTFESRLFVGTGKYAYGQMMQDSIRATGSQLVTMAMRRVQTDGSDDGIMEFMEPERYNLLPNTSGVRDAKEAIFAAQLAREALETNWLKLEIHPDPKYLMPDPIETLKAAEQLVKDGFIVLPYIHADPVLCKRLEEVGVAAVMPLAAPIGSNEGLSARRFLEIIIAQSKVPVVIDAGLGLPSHAADAMEIGADAVLVNTAIATASDPVAMGAAFKMAVECGRMAYEAGRGQQSVEAVGSSPLTAFLDA
ncbi:MAG: thiazole synthase [Lentimonas sp.]|jgi:thiazole synthase